MTEGVDETGQGVFVLGSHEASVNAVPSSVDVAVNAALETDGKVGALGLQEGIGALGEVEAFPPSRSMLPTEVVATWAHSGIDAFHVVVLGEEAAKASGRTFSAPKTILPANDVDLHGVRIPFVDGSKWSI